MQKIKAIFTLVRFPNLVFIYLTQVLTFLAFFRSSYGDGSFFSLYFIVLLPLSTVLIAAAGYIINDYFDIKIDQINKPEKVIIEKYFKRRTAILLHIALNVLAIILVVQMADFNIRLIFIQLLIILLLVVYSSTYKRKLLIGNILVSLFTSATIFIVGYYVSSFRHDMSFFKNKLFYIYVLFAFLITFYREIVKDIEDVKGDSLEHCRTLPLVFGIKKTKVIAYIISTFLIIVLFITLSISLLAILNSPIPLVIISFIFNIVIVTLLISSVIILYNSNTSKQFHQLSTLIKITTFLGILSLISFINFYAA